jgi:hypothetical protein
VGQRRGAADDGPSHASGRAREARYLPYQQLHSRGRLHGGLDLSNADVVKADLLAKFKDPGVAAHYATLWRQHETDLGRDGFETLLETLRFIWAEDKNRRTLSDAYVERFRLESEDAVKAFLSREMPPAKDIFARLADEDAGSFPAELAKRAAAVLHGLALVPNKDWLPVAVEAWRRLGATAPLLECLEGLEAVAWAMQLARRYDTERMRRYVGVLQALKRDDVLLTEKLRLTSEEAGAAWAALNEPIYGRFPTRIVRAILERLDSLLGEQRVEWSGHKTVEHILPQTPASGAYESFSDEHRATITHTLGNLVLLTNRKNASASNLPFHEKKRIYFGLGTLNESRATYASAQELSTLASWDHDTYRERHARHARLLGERWRCAPSAS